MPSHKLVNFFEIVADSLLLLTVVAASIISIGDLLFEFSDDSALLKKIPTLTLLLLVLLASGLFIERRVKFKKLDETLTQYHTQFYKALARLNQALDDNHRQTSEQFLTAYLQLRETLEHSAHGTSLDSWEAIYSDATYLAHKAKNRIRATAFGIGPWIGPPQYLQTIAEVAQTRVTDRKDFVYRVVFAYDPLPDLERANHILKRYEYFERKGLQNHIEMCHTNAHWGLDFFIVDDAHMIVALQVQSTQTIRVGLKFVDAPQIVRPFVEWYDERLWNQHKVDLDAIRRFLNS